MKQSVLQSLEKFALFSMLHGMLKLLHSMQQTTTYVPIAKALGVFSGSGVLAGMLGEIQEIDHAAKQPFICSLVLGSQSGVPGPGYFANVRKLGYAVGQTEVDEFLFWLDQMKQLGTPLPQKSVDRAAQLGITV